MTNLSQITLATDNVFGDDGAAHQVATVTGDLKGYVASLTAPVDTATAPTAGGAPDVGGPPGSGGMGAPPSDGMGVPPSG